MSFSLNSKRLVYILVKNKNLEKLYKIVYMSFSLNSKFFPFFSSISLYGKSYLNRPLKDSRILPYINFPTCKAKKVWIWSLLRRGSKIVGYV